MCSLRKRLDQRTFGRKVASITPAPLQHVVEVLPQQGWLPRWAGIGAEVTWGNESCTGPQGAHLERIELSLMPSEIQTGQERGAAGRR